MQAVRGKPGDFPPSGAATLHSRYMTESEVPADWYPDPDDDGASERYWDGEAWTELTRPTDLSAQPPPGWYPDPDTGGTTARYWAGNHWTERRRATVRPMPFADSTSGQRTVEQQTPAADAVESPVVADSV